MNRRDALSLGTKGAAYATVCAGNWFRLLPSVGLHSSPLTMVSGGCVKNIGVATVMEKLRTPAIARTVADNFNMLTASGMKWSRLHPQPDVYDFSEADWNVDFAKQNNMRVHGHNLCWNNPQDYPDWLTARANKANARDLLMSHITKVVSRYRGQVDSWDVVNEPVVPWSKREDGLYPGIWPSLLGPEYINIAFQATKDADPAALRVLNIYRVEEGSPADELNRKLTLALLRRLLKQDVPLQAVGIESHLDAANPLDLPALVRFLEDIRSLGLEILITEFDVTENRTGVPPSDWDRVVVDRYQSYLHSILEVANPKTVIFWSLLDRWEGKRKVQGLFEPDLRPRASFDAVQTTLRRSCCLKRAVLNSRVSRNSKALANVKYNRINF